MAKNITPQLGLPFDRIINDLMQLDAKELNFYAKDFFFYKNGVPSDDEQEDHANSLACIFETTKLSNLINPGVCATKAQIAGLLENLIEAINDKKNPIGPKHLVPHMYRFLPFFQMINSFRIDCNNCLNDWCEQRDPAHPLADVTKRVPEKK